MPCKACGNESAGEKLCLKCGYPEVDEEQARLLKQAFDYLATGEPDRAIKNIQPVIRSSPGSFLAHCLLADAYRRKADKEKPLRGLAAREYESALKLLPPDREAHVFFIGLAGRLGEIESLDSAYPEMSRDLPFAAECRKMINAASYAGEPAEAGPFRLTNYISAKALAIMAVGVAAIGVTYYIINRLPAPDSGSSGGGTAAAVYEPGANLVRNGDATGEWTGWQHYGKAAIVTESSPFFRIAGNDTEEGQIDQQFPLPVSRPSYLLVVARTRAALMPPDQMSGLPNIWGSIHDGKGKVLTWMQEYNLLHRHPAGEWGVSWGVFELPPEAASVHLVLKQALGGGGTRVGNSADFDNVAAYLFNSIVPARDFAEQYNGEPPQGKFLESAAPGVAGAVTRPQLPKDYTAQSTDRELNFSAAKTVFDALNPGMPVAEAGNITGMTSRGSWSQDYGLSMNPNCITLVTYIKEDKVARVELRSQYDENGREFQPGKLLLEKGSTYEEASAR
jgi:hypothetical protein